MLNGIRSKAPMFSKHRAWMSSLKIPWWIARASRDNRASISIHNHSRPWREDVSKSKWGTGKRTHKSLDIGRTFFMKLKLESKETCIPNQDLHPTHTWTTRYCGIRQVLDEQIYGDYVHPTLMQSDSCECQQTFFSLQWIKRTNGAKNPLRGLVWCACFWGNPKLRYCKKYMHVMRDVSFRPLT